MKVLDSERMNWLIAQVTEVFISHDCNIEKAPFAAYAYWGPRILANREVIYVKLNAFDEYLDAQFVYQYAHELLHFYNSKKELPSKVQWFDEFLCANIAFHVLDEINNPDYKDYLNINLPKPLITSSEDAMQTIFDNIKSYWENPSAVYDAKRNLRAFLFLNRDKIGIWQLTKLFRNFYETSAENSLSLFVNAITDSTPGEFLRTFLPVKPEL